MRSPGLTAFKAKLARFQPHIFNSASGRNGSACGRGAGEVKPRAFLALSQCCKITRSESSVAWGSREGRVSGSSPFLGAGAPSSCHEHPNPPWQWWGLAGAVSLPTSACSSSALPRALNLSRVTGLGVPAKCSDRRHPKAQRRCSAGCSETSAAGKYRGRQFGGGFLVVWAQPANDPHP